MRTLKKLLFKGKTLLKIGHKSHFFQRSPIWLKMCILNLAHKVSNISKEENASSQNECIMDSLGLRTLKLTDPLSI